MPDSSSERKEDRPEVSVRFKSNRARPWSFTPDIVTSLRLTICGIDWVTETEIDFLYTGGGDGNNWGIKMRPSPDELRPRNSTMRIWKRVR